MRNLFIAGNWKMHKTVEQSVQLAKDLVSTLKDGKYKYLIAPSFTALHAVSQVLKGTNILLAAQNMNPNDEGAYTGEVSPLQLLSAGVQFVILGHSERRQIYGETDTQINAKVLSALNHGLKVILCVGETLQERDAGLEKNICENQTKKALDGVSDIEMKNITIAYEPVWAIGTGKTATPEDAQTIHSHIRKTISELYTKEIADKTIIQYGGSMKGSNAKSLLSMPDIDGGLIGGASLKAETFAEIALCQINK